MNGSPRRRRPERPDRDAYLELEKPSEAVPVRYFSVGRERALRRDRRPVRRAGPDVRPRDAPHRPDGRRGQGQRSKPHAARLRQSAARSGNEPSGATFPASGRPPHGPVQPEGMAPREQSRSSGGVNEPKTEPDRGRATPCPGADRAPAPAQLNNPPTTPPALIRTSTRMFSNLDLQATHLRTVDARGHSLSRAHPRL